MKKLIVGFLLLLGLREIGLSSLAGSQVGASWLFTDFKWYGRNWSRLALC